MITRPLRACFLTVFLLSAGIGQLGFPRCQETREARKKVPHEILLSSPAFAHLGLIPSKYTCDARDVSPPLKWTSVPAGTKSFAVVCDDPDAPRGTWVHWVLYNIPAKARELTEEIPKDNTLKDGSCQGTNDFPSVGYGGPCPPRGKPHRYFFKIYALDVSLDLRPGATKEQLLRAMKGHVLGSGELVGTFGR